jgi:serine/threonine protein kinase
LIGDSGQTYGIQADMWALGLSLLEIVGGGQPFANMSSFQTMMTIRAWTPTIPTNPKISNDMKQLITYLYVDFFSPLHSFFYYLFFRLKRNVEERPRTYLEILDIPSIKDINVNPSDDEKAFVSRILDNIPPSNE